MLAQVVCLLALAAQQEAPARTDASSPAAQAAVEREKLRALVEAQREPAIERRARILDELGQTELPPRWAGEFTSQRGEITFTVAPKAGITVCSRTDIPHSDRWNHGTVVASGERWIDVELVLPHEAVTRAAWPRRVPCTAKRFHLVSWRDRDFLVPEHELLHFCNTYNSRTDATYRDVGLSRFSSRANGHIDDVDSIAHRVPPVLPAEARKYLLDHVVKGHITALDAPVQNGTYAGGEPLLEVTVTADVGLKDGLQLGMWIFREGTSHFASGEIIDIGATTCRAVFRVIDPMAKEKQSAAAVGDGVTTCMDADGEPDSAERAAAELLRLVALAEEQRHPAIERLARIGEELRQTDLPRWAGRFTSRGMITFDVAPRAGITVFRSSDQRWNHGSIVASGERWIDVELALPHEAFTDYDNGRAVAWTAKRLHLVSWRDREFLVPEPRLIPFCNAFNSRVKTRDFVLSLRFSSRSNGRAIETDSPDHRAPPELPSEFRKYVLDHVVLGCVTALRPAVQRGTYEDGTPRFETIVTADVGEGDGLQMGMALFLEGSSASAGGEIIDIDEYRCRFVVGDRDPETEGPIALAVGSAVTSCVEMPGRRSATAKPDALRVELDRRAKAEAPAAVERLARIDAELQQAGLPRWAGRFSLGRGYATFSAAPAAGFVACTSYDVAGTDRWNHGRIVASGERWFDVELTLPHDALTHGSNVLDRRVPLTAKRFHLVTWRDQEFLVPEHRMIEACNAYNALSIRTIGSDGMLTVPYRENARPPDADSREVHAPPDVPEEYRKYLLDHVVSGHVTELGKVTELDEPAYRRPRSETIVTVDLGSRDQLLPGMVLYFFDRNAYGGGEILEVTDQTCRVAFRREVGTTMDWNDRAITVGDAVATRVEGVKRVR